VITMKEPRSPLGGEKRLPNLNLRNCTKRGEMNAQGYELKGTTLFGRGFAGRKKRNCPNQLNGCVKAKPNGAKPRKLPPFYRK